jgi:phosphonate transport system substrate-binding protein
MKLRRQSTRCAYGLAAGWLVWAALPFAAAGGERVSDAATLGLRIAISESVAGEVNGNDLRAAIKTWAEAVGRQTGVRIEPELCTTAQLVQRIRNRQVDAFSLNILEFERVAAYADHELVMDEVQLPDGEEYVLLVHQSSGIQSLADLRARSLLLYRNPRMCLARIWLDTLLASAHLGAADTFMGRIESSPKLSRVVLPVFFRQTDACLVTRRGYTTMCELNPQLAKQLHPLAVSPKLMTAFLAFHKDSPPDSRRRFLTGITDLHKTVEGRQAITLFGGTRLVRTDVSALRTSLELLHAYERLKSTAPAAGQ